LAAAITVAAFTAAATVVADTAAVATDITNEIEERASARSFFIPAG
jgi:hypothetical protein